jgi:hypothetical protein
VGQSGDFELILPMLGRRQKMFEAISELLKPYERGSCGVVHEEWRKLESERTGARNEKCVIVV